MRQLPVLLVLLGACASAPPGPPPPSPTPIPVVLPRDVHWVRNSAEYHAITIQTYRAATDRVREVAAARARGSWAVILDADETVLDNSEYQRRLALSGATYASDTWNAWVREQAATAVPGAAAFIRTARELGGRVAIVTNRDDEVCDPTRANLRSLGIEVDVVLCRRMGVSDKNPRFAAVAEGSAAPGMAALEVVLWVGDNIQDFPGQSQDVRTQAASAFDAFGRTYFVLPNPMYGSWERNPAR